MTPRNTARSSREFLSDLEAALAQSEMSEAAFGRRYFDDCSFLKRMRAGFGVYASTLAKIEHVLELMARGELAPAPDPCAAEQYLPRLVAARHALGLREWTFGRRFLGDGTFFARARRVTNFKPETVEMIERVLAELKAGQADNLST